METYEVLEKALNERIPDESHWCQYALETPRDDGGTAYCALGALWVIDDYGHEVSTNTEQQAKLYDAPRQALRRILIKRGFRGDIPRFNNSHTYQEVRELFQEAIRQEKAKLGIDIEIPAESAQPVEA